MLTSSTEAIDSRLHLTNTTRPDVIFVKRRAASSPADARRHARITVAPALLSMCAIAKLGERMEEGEGWGAALHAPAYRLHRFQDK